MPYSDKYSDLYGPAFPLSQLDVRVELLLGGVWTNVSKLFYQRGGMQITRGHPDESSSAQPSSAVFQLNNRSGNLSPRNPNGAYYGLIGRNTPCRVSLPASGTYLRLEQDSVSYIACPDRNLLDVTGNIDVRLDMWPSHYAPQVVTLAAKGVRATNQISWILEMGPDGTLMFWWSPDGTLANTVFVVSTLPIPVGRIAVRATLAVATGTVTFYTASTISGSWTQLGAAASGTSGAATSVFASTAPIQIASSIGSFSGAFGGLTVNLNGKVYGFQLLNGIGGTVVASPDFTAQVPGTAPFADAQGNIWTVSGTAEISNRTYRHHGEVPAWPQRWDNTGQDVYVPVAPAGLLRRLTQGTPPQQSSLYRGYGTVSGAAAAVAYWPCEDGSNATSIASALPAGAPMTFSGTPSLSSNSNFVCSQPIPVLNGSAWVGAVPTNTTWSANVLRFLLQVPAAGDVNNGVVARMYTTGTVARTDLVYTTAGSGTLTVNCYNEAGTLLGTGSITSFINATGNFVTGCNGLLLRVDLDLQISGSTVTAQLLPMPIGFAAAPITTVTVASASLGAVSQVAVNPGGVLTQSAVGHVLVQSVFQSVFDATQFQALSAHIGETAAARFARLCSEQSLNCRIVGFPNDSVAMGYQPTADFVTLLQQCEDADRGLMFETRQTLGLGYRTRASLCNQTAAAALNYAAAHLSPPLEPTDDDQTAVNDVTVTRSTGSITGSSSRQYLASGAMSIQAPPAGIGEYPTALSLNLASDPQARQLAGWILNVGTVDAPRYPTLTLDLSRTELAALFYSILDADIGDLLTVGATPSWLPPDGISQIMRGFAESLNAFELTIAPVCAPAAPYTVAVYDSTGSHYDTDGSTVAGAITATAPTMKVATTNSGSPLWTTAAGDFPFDVTVSIGGTNGERMTVTGISGASSPQTFTVTRGVNGVVRGWPNGADVRLFQPAIYAL